jgi:hypothetical protein
VVARRELLSSSFPSAHRTSPSFLLSSWRRRLWWGKDAPTASSHSACAAYANSGARRIVLKSYKGATFREVSQV